MKFFFHLQTKLHHLHSYLRRPVNLDDDGAVRKPNTTALTFDLNPELGPAVPCAGQGEGSAVDGVGGEGELLHALAAPPAPAPAGISHLVAVEVLDASRPLSLGAASYRHGLQEVVHGCIDSRGKGGDKDGSMNSFGHCCIFSNLKSHPKKLAN